MVLIQKSPSGLNITIFYLDLVLKISKSICVVSAEHCSICRKRSFNARVLYPTDFLIFGIKFASLEVLTLSWRRWLWKLKNSQSLSINPN